MTETTAPPPDQPQESEPPDLDLLLSAVRELLTDVSLHYAIGAGSFVEDLALRTAALRSVVVRMIEHRAERGTRPL